MPDFMNGKQPCQNYDPKDEVWSGFGNTHQCYAPLDRPDGPRCGESSGGIVSFCLNCNSDHHSGGYETCAGRLSAGGRNA